MCSRVLSHLANENQITKNYQTFFSGLLIDRHTILLIVYNFHSSDTTLKISKYVSQLPLPQHEIRASSNICYLWDSQQLSILKLLFIT